ncbi:hypothetical protein [Streptomyces lunalinharesii]|uniref:SnoaL-like domain-containing protein n=1 Tax=Streptomyces lunalinharesii TaxID=333384 RepID=A0ABP6EFG2_9ACTN
MSGTVADLMRRNLLEVFDEPAAERRAAAVAEIYSEDVRWHETGRAVIGRKALARRAEQPRTENPDWVFQPDGPVSQERTEPARPLRALVPVVLAGVPDLRRTPLAHLYRAVHRWRFVPGGPEVLHRYLSTPSVSRSAPRSQTRRDQGGGGGV